MLDAFDTMLNKCSLCHDQCLFVTAEVFATGRQSLATSRKAALIQAVCRGEMAWTPAAVEVIYSGLSSGVQHTFCVHRGNRDGWPDETLYLRAARAAIVASGAAPTWALALRDAWRRCGNPYGLRDDEHQTASNRMLFVFDAATRAFSPQVMTVWLRLAERFGESAVALRKGSTGFELFDLGFTSEARAAAQQLYEHLSACKPAKVISDSPEAVYMMKHVWPAWGLTISTLVQHASEWLAEQIHCVGIDVPTLVQRERVTFQDPAYLARYLGSVAAPRAVLNSLGFEVVEMLRHGAETLPTGSFYGSMVGAWTEHIAYERVESAKAVGATRIVTASPFDHRNLTHYHATRDLGEITLESMSFTKRRRRLTDDGTHHLRS